jgi:hypothetical protein
VSRGFDEGYLEKVRSYHGTGPYEKAMRKRKVWSSRCSPKRRTGTG